MGALFVLPTPRLLVAAAGRTSAGLLVQFRIEADGSLARVQALGQPDLKAPISLAVMAPRSGAAPTATATTPRLYVVERGEPPELVAINPITLRALRRWKLQRGDGDGGVGVALPNGDLIVGTSAGDGAALVQLRVDDEGTTVARGPEVRLPTSHVTCGFSDPLGKYAYFASAASPALFARVDAAEWSARALKASLTLDAADGPVTSCAFDAHRQIAYLGMGGAAGRVVAVAVAAMARLPGAVRVPGYVVAAAPSVPSASYATGAPLVAVSTTQMPPHADHLLPATAATTAGGEALLVRLDDATVCGDCGAHGTCSCGACTCSPGWSGPKCEVGPTCPASCSGHGQCAFAGVCRCDAGWGGKDCSEAACPGGAGGCSGHGVCKGAGQCECFDGWGGADCAAPLCAHNCSSHGSCAAPGACKCDDGWEGHDCATPACPGACSGHGTCGKASLSAERRSFAQLAGLPHQCTCFEGWTGADCATPLCPAGCSGRGRCESPGRCRCQPGWTGPECTKLACPAVGGCLHGTCVAGGASATTGADALGRRCACHPGWSGPRCSHRACPATCRGACTEKGCVCSTPYLRGDDCTQPYCGASACSGHGHCALSPTRAPLSQQPASPMCVCKPGWSGIDCETPVCPNGCGGHGSCVSPGACRCDAGWGGARRQLAECEACCSGHGECVGGKSERRCMCASGWRGRRARSPSARAAPRLARRRSATPRSSRTRRTCTCDTTSARRR